MSVAIDSLHGVAHLLQAIKLAPTNHIFYSNRSLVYTRATGLLRLANAQRQLGKNEAAMATMALANGGGVPAKRAKQESAAPLPSSVQKELQELQPQFQSLHRELETVRPVSHPLHPHYAVA
ncbi:hypothetical protein B5M09_001199 [Aphanomyces astaci]|uniref:Uncharacterized protein n=1 Tax=Aphanomyces astaci TaxID=112090 RepID=A0A425CXX2_APHAT|nr:hypothetical protein B5M09_001199 [Aphanomyces astaci]